MEMVKTAGMVNGRPAWQRERIFSHKESVIDVSSRKRKNAVTGNLLKARDLIQQAAKLMDECGYETVWEDEITKLSEKAADLGFAVDDLKAIIARWY